MTIESFDGKTPQLGERVFVAPMAYINGDITIGDDSSVWPGVVIRGDMHWVKIGSRTSVQDGSVLHTTHKGQFSNGHPLSIGDQVTIGHMVCLHGCTIGNKVLVGIGAKVLDGAVVEDKVVIAAGSLVPPGKRLESGFMYMGSPVKQTRPLTQKELDFFEYTTDHYVRTKDKYLAEMGQ
ncbi:MAG TPA: gamma carbonic anhydrase family protein [Gammaproteobacteria bacterium]|nr:gamma carbonic anhydrase family protein [Gammaproteobacteria bacterium]MBK83385.1 gamma carbonic anhydrase family protein [Gammaproteobacteria bacterium]MEC8011027.1 gamma carbonic anhydrase family protein [Pseudomonadota bacterium]HBF08081.1 gamma carbonic anhydrase family protein [Gammaproteobacteria bacterium]HCK91712.1 gamma carbonic anhydrase family protein [Gammaproteobacteria bacterium]|tara:strand:+ start:331 stop:867 length:537 start_codon:yes stop_codon:yes gene_type:complete